MSEISMNKIITKEITQHCEDVNGVNETLFHNANGYLGVRGCLEEGVPKDWDTMRGTYINGFYDIIPMKQAESLCNFVEEKETMLNVVDIQTVYLSIEDEVFNLSLGTTIKHTRTLNMEDGYTLREIIWRSPSGKEVAIRIKRMASFEQLNLFMMTYEVKALNFTGEVKLQSWHIADVKNYCNPKDPRLAAESIENLHVQEMNIEHDISIATSETVRSKLGMCSAVGHKFIGKNEHSFSKMGETRAVCQVAATLEQGEAFILEKYCILADSIRYQDVKKSAMTDLKNAMKSGSSYYEMKQRAYLDHFWQQSEMTIEGDEAANQAVNFNMYQLLQSVAKDSYCNVAAKGMSGEGYEGHYFWDTEMFILPFFILTNPDLAKMLLSYRYQTLDKARENAKLLGHQKGALFPWRTITGVECSGYYPSGTAQYHIDGDIAYAVVSYYLTTGDLAFIKEQGAEIVVETARLWMDLGHYVEGQFVINDVTGPDEYTCIVNNNYFTNSTAKYNLEWAVKLCERLKEQGQEKILYAKLKISDEELENMELAAKAMYLPYDLKKKINPQDDSFLEKPIWDLEDTPKEKFPLLLHYHPLHLYRYQVCKQADTILAYFQFGDEQPVDVMKRSYAYYEKITTHDSSLSTCVFSIVASRLEMQEKAYEYFGDSVKLDLENTHHNTKDGIHTANMGGCYMAIVNGFAGVKIIEKGLYLAPFVPGKWKGYCFKMKYQGRLLKIEVSRSDVTVTLLSGEAVPITLYGKTYQLKSKEKIIL